MQKIDDIHIRKELLDKLKNQSQKPKAVVEELRVHNGNAIADVVALFNEAHCFEIKGDGDKIERILKQGHYYNLSFPKITLVTTKRHVKKAILIAPPFWGIMVAETKDVKISLKYLRRAKHNKYFDKNLAILTLWKSEMLDLTDGSCNKLKKMSRNSLADIISSNIRKKDLSLQISSLLFQRYQQIGSAS